MQKLKKEIDKKIKETYALGGYSSISMRKIACDLGITQSTIYNYYESKEIMLKYIFDKTRKEIGVKRSKLENPNNLMEMLRQRIEFQFQNGTDVIFILKYFLHFRNTFHKNKKGYVPVAAYKHIEEVLEYGNSIKEIKIKNIDSEAKIITHAINGFVLEYYPDLPKGVESKKLFDSISNFVYRSLKNY